MRKTHTYEQLAAAIVPKSNSNDPFWENAGKELLTGALRKIANIKDIEALYYLLAQEDLAKFSQFFRGTEAATYTHMDGEKMTISIRATLASQIRSFKLLKNTEDPFSVRNWGTDQTQNNWLFLSAWPRSTGNPEASYQRLARHCQQRSHDNGTQYR